MHLLSFLLIVQPSSFSLLHNLVHVTHHQSTRRSPISDSEVTHHVKGGLVENAFVLFKVLSLADFANSNIVGTSRHGSRC